MDDRADLTALREGRLLVDGDGPGPWNMAADEVLLEEADRGRLTLRFYSWSPSTLSLGYFQSAGQRAEHVASQSLALVRRASGGGALVHDDRHHELTYSVAVPGPQRGPGAHLRLYDLMHGSLIEALAAMGVEARTCRAEIRSSRGAPFLCFQRRSSGDVLLGSAKIAGSAQRRSASALLQHGSVLIQQSIGAPELPGIRQLCPVELTSEQLRQRWLEALQRRWPICWHLDRRTADEDVRIDEKVSRKFGHPDWTLRR